LTIYEQLRSIGVSVETADALEPILEGLPDKKREAFFLWASGMTQFEAAKASGVPLRTFKRVLSKIKWHQSAYKI
jgi:DNA-directed RNA polymerase specialized sigma24 family protein